MGAVDQPFFVNCLGFVDWQELGIVVTEHFEPLFWLPSP